MIKVSNDIGYSKDIEDINYFMEFLESCSEFNQLVVLFKDEAVKILRKNYYPDDKGLVVFDKLTDWSKDGFSVYEMTELLTKYRDKISKIQFIVSDGSTQDFVNAYESEVFSDYGSFSSVIIVGDGDGVINFHGKVNQETSRLNWSSDTLYGSYRKSFTR